MLQEKREGFFAEELCQDLSHIGRATIYRTIKLLLDAGGLCKLSLPNGTPKYTLAESEHHHHTVCIKCGNLGDFKDSTAERVLKALGSEIPGEIIGHRMELYLICQNCLKAA